MNNMLKIFSIALAKLALFLARLRGGDGTAIPGKIAHLFYADILKDLARNITAETIIVTGTNGKTTTTNMIAAIMAENGASYIHNSIGANMYNGVLSTFIEKTNWRGNKKYEYAVLEADEAFVPIILKETGAKKLLITNFFADQLDRYGEINHIINVIKQGVNDNPVHLILNADDPLTASLAEAGISRCYFSVGDKPDNYCQTTEKVPANSCPVCGKNLHYQIYHYAQLGRYKCIECGFSNPDSDFIATDVTISPHIEISVNGAKFVSPYQGFYNVYNVLAAISLAFLLGIKAKNIREALKNFQPQAGRMEPFFINGKKVTLALVKNDTGLNQVINTILYDKENKALMAAINDTVSDGRDVSWLWDAHLERFNTDAANISNIVLGGSRSGDLAVRFKYAGADCRNIVIKDNLQDAVAAVIDNQAEKIYILCNYTAMFECRPLLELLEKQSEERIKQERRYQTG